MPVIDAPRGNNAAAHAPVRAAPKAAPPSAPARALQAFHTSEVQSHVPAVAQRNVQMGQRAAAKLPQRYVAQTPQATALQAFHTSEAQSHVPAVAQANLLRGELAAAGQADRQAEARHQAALALISAHHSGGFGLGSITNPLVHISAAGLNDVGNLASGAASGIGNVAAHLGSDIVNLPASTVQAGWELAKAPIHDALTAAMNLSHGASATQALPTSDTVNLVKGMAQQDPLFQLATLHPGRAAALSYQHPLTAITDALGAAGVVGRAAGAATRAAGVAEHLAPLARLPKELPGGINPIERRFSPNLIVAKAQHALDARGNPIGRALPDTVHIGHVDLPLSGFAREMYRRANEHQLESQAMAQKAGEFRRAHPIMGPGGQLKKPIEQQVSAERAAAERTALLHTIRQNALTNPRTGDIFYTGKDVPRLYRTDLGPGLQTREMQNLAAQGTHFVRRQLPPEFVGRGQLPVSVVIPKTLHDTLAAHRAISMEHATVPGQAWGYMTQRFRRTVLPFSTKWILGNASEATLRSGLRGVSPTHVALGKNLTKAMRASGLGTEADRLEAQALQGTHFSFQKRESAQYSADHPLSKVPGAAPVAHVLSKPADFSFGKNQQLEQGFAHGVLGKHASAYLKLIKDQNPGLTHEQHMTMLAHQYAKPEMARDAGRFGRSVLGQYAAFGPGVSKFVHKFAPFAPWYGNSVKFMGTLPVRHPVATATILNAARATDKQWKKEHEAIKGIGGDLMSFPMVGKEKALDLGRYFPPGAFTSGYGLPVQDAALADLGQTIVPQVSDAFKAALGLDPFGKPLAYPGPVPGKILKSGKPSKATVHYATAGTPHAANAASDILSAMFGFAQPARRVLGERGGTPYSGTDLLWNPTPPIKGGAPPFDIKHILAGINKVFNPVNPVNLTPRRPAKKPVTRRAFPSIRGLPSFGGGGASGPPSL